MQRDTLIGGSRYFAESVLWVPPSYPASAAMDDMAPAPAMTTILQTTADWARGAMLFDRLAVAGAMVEVHTGEEIAALRRAVAAEDRLAYDEPRNWLAPTRQSLGAALLRANDPRGAELVYLEDLKQNPANGWSLFGLAEALRAQGRTREANMATAAFHQAWRLADVTPAASAY